MRVLLGSSDSNLKAGFSSFLVEVSLSLGLAYTVGGFSQGSVGFGKLLEGPELMDTSLVHHCDEGICGGNGVAGVVPLGLNEIGLLASGLNSLVLGDNRTLGSSMCNVFSERHLGGNLVDDLRDELVGYERMSMIIDHTMVALG